jgi:hypothetical protein
MAEALRRPIATGPMTATAPAISRPTVHVGFRPTVPAHVGTMLGLSVAGYGVALALVTGLQSSTDAAVNANRAPVAAAIDRIAAGHDRLDSTLQGAAGAYNSAATSYQGLADNLAAVEQRLSALAASVSAVDGASKALPASVAMPPIIRSVRVSAGTTSHATSGGTAAP